MLGFKLDKWDYITFACLMFVIASGLTTLVLIAGLPGKIAIKRKHPDAEAVRIMGWAGLLAAVVPWIQAFIWAFKPTDIVDIRRFPKDERKAIEEALAKMTAPPPKRRRKRHELADDHPDDHPDEPQQGETPPENPEPRH
jgi:hypothetical protein